MTTKTKTPHPLATRVHDLRCDHDGDDLEALNVLADWRHDVPADLRQRLEDVVHASNELRRALDAACDSVDSWTRRARP